MRNFFAPALVSLAFAVAFACGPPPKPTEHPGKARFGTPCDDDKKCPNDLECVRAGSGEPIWSCEHRCNIDSDCGVGSVCMAVKGAPSPMCRARGTEVAPAGTASGTSASGL